MPKDLRPFLDPATTAVLTMELQRGTVGDLSAIPALKQAIADRGVLTNVGRLLTGARAAGARVVHCIADSRADRQGSNPVTPMQAAMARHGDSAAGGQGSEPVPELGVVPSDLISSRLHGMSPFMGTSLDIWLRNMGVRTVIATGVSLNIGIVGTVISATDLGYVTLVPRDCVVGLPVEYGEMVLQNTLANLAYLTTVDDILAIWAS